MANGYFSSLDKSHHTKGLKGFEKVWTKCFELKGDCVQK